MSFLLFKYSLIHFSLHIDSQSHISLHIYTLVLFIKKKDYSHQQIKTDLKYLCYI